MPALRIFLCHASEDKDRVRELSGRLRADGFDTWLDEERLLPGQDWNLEIGKAVRESDVIVVCVSARSASKTGYVQKELRTILDAADEQPEGRVFVVPVRLEDCPLPRRLAQWQSADLFSDRGYERLCATLKVRSHDRAGPPESKPESAASGPEQRRRFPIWIALAIPLGALAAYIYYMGRSTGAPPVNKQPAGPPQISGMRAVPGGRFLMGRNDGPDPEASPAHEVVLAPYFIDEKPITNATYREFLRSANRPGPAPSSADDEPVTNVTWDEAYAYCAARAKRLPTEAEWEFAARGQDGRLYPWGEIFDAGAVNFAESPSRRLEPVGARAANRSPFGVLDLAGNVWQWCADEYRHYPGRNSSVAIPAGAKVIRGGSFHSEQWQVAAVARNLELPTKRSLAIGFRCAK